MGSRRSPSFSLVFVATATLLLLLSAQSTDARFRGINQFCRTSDHRLLCTAMVNGAQNWHEAVFNAIHSTLAIATRMKRLLPTVGPALTDLPVESRDSTLQACQSNFGDAVDNLMQALTFLEAKDTGSLNSYLSAVSISDCLDGFDMLGASFPSPVAKIARLMNRQVNECLAVSQQI